MKISMACPHGVDYRYASINGSGIQDPGQVIWAVTANKKISAIAV